MAPLAACDGRVLGRVLEQAATRRSRDDDVSHLGASSAAAALRGVCLVLIEPRASPRRIEGGSVVLGPILNRPVR